MHTKESLKKATRRDENGNLWVSAEDMGYLEHFPNAKEREVMAARALFECFVLGGQIPEGSGLEVFHIDRDQLRNDWEDNLALLDATEVELMKRFHSQVDGMETDAVQEQMYTHYKRLCVKLTAANIDKLLAKMALEDPARIELLRASIEYELNRKPELENTANRPDNISYLAEELGGEVI